MKKLILLLSVLLVGCMRDPMDPQDINCIYSGAHVIEHDTFWNTYTLKYKGEILYTGYYENQSHYRVGDTINGQCLK